MQGDPLEKGSKVNEVMLQTRKRKGLSAEPFPLDHFLDKM